MIVDKNVFMYRAAGPAPGTGNTRTAERNSNRSAWQREMERQELAAWFSHSAVQPGRAAPVPPVAHVEAVPRAASAMAPVAATGSMAERMSGGTEHPAPTAVARPSRPHGSVAAGASARDERSAAQDPGPGNRTSGNEDDIAFAAASSGAPRQPVGTWPMPAADLVAAVMTHLGRDFDMGPSAGTGGPAPAPVLLDVEGESATAARPASIAAPLAPGAPAAAPLVPRSLQMRAAGMPSGESTPTEDVPGARTGSTARGWEAGAPLPQLRIHTVRTEDGVRIWIGADQAAGLSGEQLLYAAHDIQRLLKEEGMPLVALTYNGESVLDGEDGPDENGELADADATSPRVRGKSGTSPRIET